MGKVYLTADEVAEALGISKGHAYVLIRECNNELRKKGFLCISGKVPIKYFSEKYYGFEEAVKGPTEKVGVMHAML